jgi:hypothetical protein
MVAKRIAERITGKQRGARIGCTDFARHLIGPGGAGMVARIEIGSLTSASKWSAQASLLSELMQQWVAAPLY